MPIPAFDEFDVEEVEPSVDSARVRSCFRLGGSWLRHRECEYDKVCSKTAYEVHHMAVGKLKLKVLTAACAEYLKRMQPYGGRLKSETPTSIPRARAAWMQRANREWRR